MKQSKAPEGGLSYESIFSKGFAQFLLGGDFSDYTLVSVEDVEYRVHGLILAYSSKYFRKMMLQQPVPKEETPAEPAEEEDTPQVQESAQRGRKSLTPKSKRSKTPKIYKPSKSSKKSKLRKLKNDSPRKTFMAKPSALALPSSQHVESIVNSEEIFSEQSMHKMGTHRDTINAANGPPVMRRLKLPLPDPHRVFPIALEFCYNGYVDALKVENCIPLLPLADFYQIEGLKEQCSAIIASTIDRENAVAILYRAVECHATDIIDKCIDIVAANFAYIYNADYNALPFDVYYRILDHPGLAAKSLGEFRVYKRICRYRKMHKDLTEEQITKLFATVRYRWMSTDEIESVKRDALVDGELLIEALCARVKEYEGKDNMSNNKRLLPRKDFGIKFEYESDFDTKGALYWIATNSGRDHWTNPHTSNAIRVSSSGVEKGNEKNLANRKASELWTGDVPASWFAIDIGVSRSLIPMHYTLRHGGNYKADSLRTWDFQGSQDGEDWTLLLRHIQDENLSGPFATHSWSVPDITTSYRYFRILQTGHNSSKHNFLVLSGIEIYGILYEKAQM
eukprot:TRINITY_DN15975_c0_g1_i1.p1 TRINITY_DN15975_c0_g1~~TRINITY_DN15975_c0_g1_i1.p1  ORF type:complete len:565 (-),score=81.34 TRINITY_DN15975_c0_g1_i1:25-1719(-)